MLTIKKKKLIRVADRITEQWLSVVIEVWHELVMTREGGSSDGLPTIGKALKLDVVEWDWTPDGLVIAFGWQPVASEWAKFESTEDAVDVVGTSYFQNDTYHDAWRALAGVAESLLGVFLRLHTGEDISVKKVKSLFVANEGQPVVSTAGEAWDGHFYFVTQNMGFVLAVRPDDSNVIELLDRSFRV